jgi:hypothetical protein
MPEGYNTIAGERGVKDGAIAEHGTHAELLKLGGVYACLYELQFQRGEEAEVSGAK